MGGDLTYSCVGQSKGRMMIQRKEMRARKKQTRNCISVKLQQSQERT